MAIKETAGQSPILASTQSPWATEPVGQEDRQCETAERQEDAIYQKNRVVARVLGPEINLEAKQIHFTEINNSDELLLPDECEFRQHRIVVRKIGYATKVERHSLENGRILQDVKAEILGNRQQ